jgi:hypothetical protein
VDAVPETLETGRPVGELGRDVEPSEAVGDGRPDALVARPEGHVPIPQAVDPVLRPSLLDGGLVRGGGVAEGEARRVDLGREGVGHVASDVAPER